MLFDQRITINEIVTLTANGVVTGSFAQIRGALIDRFKAIYGSDIDMSTGTADGVLVNDLALIVYNMAQTIQALYQQMDINQASGRFLDSLAALANVYRKAATNSYTYVTMTFTGDNETTYTSDQLAILDRSGLTWAPAGSVTFTPTSGTAVKSVQVFCADAGAISAPAGWLYEFSNAALPISFTQSEAAIVGADEEDDIALRSRIYRSSGSTGLTVLEGLVNALLNIQGVEDVYIYNNPADAPQSAGEHSQSVDPHSVYVVLRLKDGVAVGDALIGTTIYDNLTPGVGTTECINPLAAKSYIYNLANLGPNQTLLPVDVTATVNWKQAGPETGDLEFTLVPQIKNGVILFDPEEISGIVESIVSQLNSRHINDSISEDEFLSLILSADPLYNGQKTYTVTDIGGQSGTLVPAELSDNYYQYSGNYSVAEDPGTPTRYIVTISEA